MAVWLLHIRTAYEGATYGLIPPADRSIESPGCKATADIIPHRRYAPIMQQMSTTLTH